MTENEKREFDHLLGGVKLIIKMHDDTPPHGRFGLPQFQMEAVAALVKQLEAQEKEVNQLKVEIDLLASLRSAANTSAENWKTEALSQEERADDFETALTEIVKISLPSSGNELNNPELVKIFYLAGDAIRDHRW